jgi:hypothetical protein
VKAKLLYSTISNNFKVQNKQTVKIENIQYCAVIFVQALFLRKAELGFFHFLEVVTGWLVPSALVRRSQYSLAGTFPPQKKIPSLLKTGFFRQVRELKIQRKNPGSALGIFIKNSWFFGKTLKIQSETDQGFRVLLVLMRRTST